MADATVDVAAVLLDDDDRPPRRRPSKDTSPPLAPRTIGVTWGDQLEPRRLGWLWPGRLATGKVNIAEGDPGLGKSLVTTDLTARITTGRTLPDGGELDGPGKVLIASAEDTVEDVILPRLHAAGADLSRVAFHRLTRDSETGVILPLTIPADLDALARTIVANGIGLVILDPLVAFLSEDIRSHVDASVRRAMGPLAIMAEETQAAVLGLRHLNKSSDDNPLYRGGGSIAFSAAARSVLLFARHPDDRGLHVMAQVKTNLAAPSSSPSLGYRIESVDTAYGSQPVVTWLAEPLAIAATDLLRRPGGRDDAPKRSQAEAFLVDILSDGPLEVAVIKQLAKDAGVSWRTVERAKDGSGMVVPERVRDGAGKTLGWRWRLSEEVPDEAL